MNLPFASLPNIRVLPWLGLLLLGLAGSPAMAEDGATLRLGVLEFRGEADARSRWSATARYLDEALADHRVELRPLDFNQLEQVVARGDVDLVLTNPGFYARLEYLHGARPLASLDTGLRSGQGCCRFGAVVFTRADRDDLRHLRDLERQRIAAVHEHSFGGYQMLLRELHELGISQHRALARMDFLGDHDAVVQAVLSGRYDAGVVRTGILEAMAEERRVRLDAFRVVGARGASEGLSLRLSTRLYPEWPLAALPHVPVSLANQVSVALLSMPEEHPAARAAGIQGWTAPLNYQPVHELLYTLRLAPYDAPRHLGLSDLWAQYRWQISAGLLLLFGLALALFRGQRLNRRLAEAGRLLQSRVEMRTEHLNVANRSLQREVEQRRQAQAEVLAQSRRQAQVLETVDEAIFGLDADCRVEFANPAAEALAGRSIGQMHGHRLSEVLQIRDGQGRSVWEGQGDCLAGDPMPGDIRRAYDQTLYHRDGRVLVVDYAFRPILDGARVRGGVFSCRDITGRKRIEESLRLHARVFDTATEGVMIADARARILSVNRAFEQVTGYSAEEVVGRNPSLLSSGRQDKAFYRRMWDTIKHEGIWTGEIWNRRKDGEIYPEWLTISTLTDPDGEVSHFVAVFSDITAQKRSEQEIDFLANHDPLTGLANRNLFEDRLGHAISMAGRNGQHVGLLLLDLDRFRLVNDGMGHGPGDALLRETGRRLGRCVRDSDTVARLGGDEFGIILEGLSDAADAGMQAERILEAMRAPLRLGGQELFCTASIGIAVFPADGTDAATLLRHADTAMALAKREGRNNFQFYTHALTEAVFSRLSIETGLRHALERDELRLHYQPILDVAGGRIAAMESLMRWQHPERGQVSPGVFIPVAEQSDLILALGRWALMSACAQVRAWADAGLEPVPVSVNIPARHFCQPGFVEEVLEVVREAGVQPQSLIIELTESALMEPVSLAEERIRRLRDAGVVVAIDDFGTGYSSLGYLQRFHVNYLKVDRSFVSGLPGDENARAITEAVIGVSHSLGLEVVAEGVETQAQLDYLRATGCDKVQGYLTGRPVTAEVAATLLPGAGEKVISLPG
ncbi:EAL domain-containing protein [Thioalkalivibrio sulfidiphilus]|uniref:EAL domain-containing protein n=1 Tax=Thioalkalivibrio sulfidiphilus TaxID=1033854 RepID=UPI00036AC53F|nr:EAL domain-containing protein [Thioalkalivibrio sulfidiphilus]